MYLAIFTSIASLASILGLGFQLYKNKESTKTYVLLTVSLIFVAASGATWAQNVRLTIENEKLLEARHQAAQLIAKWPKKDRFDFVSAGEFRGIVMSGMAFLEAYRNEFPETYKTTRQLMFEELEVAQNKDGNYISKRSKLQEAAEAIVTTIESIQIYEHDKS